MTEKKNDLIRRGVLSSGVNRMLSGRAEKGPQESNLDPLDIFDLCPRNGLEL